MQEDRLTKVLRVLLPRRMAEDLAEQGDDAEFVAEQLERYLTADEDGRADMAAFHDSDGVAKVDCAAVVVESATPAVNRPGRPSSLN